MDARGIAADAQVRVAIIGCGGIARAHARSYESHGELCRVVACVDVSREAADAFAQEFGCVAYTDVARMLKEARPVAVSVCTPPSSHLPVVRQVAEQQVAVLCEKPLARNLTEANEMVRLVEQSGIVFMHALCHRFHGPVNQALELCQRGVLGQLVHFYNRFAFRFAGVEKRWFTDPEVAGGGILLDTAVHSLDLFTYLMGQVTEISACVSTILPVQVEDSAAILVKSAEGVPGEISCSWVTPPGEAVLRLYGSEGVAEIDYNAVPNLRYRLAEGEWLPVRYDGPDRFQGETQHFLECVRSGSTPRITVRDGLEVMRLIEEAYASAEVPRVVPA